MDVVIQIKSDLNPAFKVKVGSVVSTASVKIESGKNKGTPSYYNSSFLEIQTTFLASGS